MSGVPHNRLIVTLLVVCAIGHLFDTDPAYTRQRHPAFAYRGMYHR